MLLASFDDVFLMKVLASRAVDTDDLTALLPFCSLGSIDEAVEAFYAAYPHEERDPYLADHLRSIP